MTQRKATIHRQTTETDIHLTLALDGNGRTQIHTGIGQALDQALARTLKTAVSHDPRRTDIASTIRNINKGEIED